MIVSGANMLLCPEDVTKADSLLAMATVVVCQLEVNPHTTLTALKLAKKHGGMSTCVCACAYAST